MSELGVANSRVPAHMLHTITKYGTRAAVDRLPWRLLKPDATAQTLSPIVSSRRGLAVNIINLSRTAVVCHLTGPSWVIFQ